MQARRLLSLFSQQRRRIVATTPTTAPARFAACQTQSYSAQSDAELLEVLRSEIDHEESSNRFQSHQGGSLGNYSVDWDGSQSQDVFIKRKYGTEDIAVSALLGPEDVETKSSFPRKVMMKVFVSKYGVTPVLQFDCGISVQDDGTSDFDIDNASCLSTPTNIGASKYRGPLFSTLDPQLQKALKGFLIDRGITAEFTDYLLLHLHEKEQAQYVNWLHKLERMISKET
ncbi:mitochondrial acidic protein mam33 [Aristolochia californica]|uniref:mitochondrial acidic protein mam33 n=1 Tax=Aristolochia californica TaxID=171875 RepID=UPI0035D63807